MSWKSLVSAGLLCVLASPAFAVPNLTVSNGGLDANGDWIWNVTVTPTAASTPVAVELGFRETNATTELLSAAKNATNFDTDNPGTQIFTWETLIDTDPGAGVNMRPVGLQTNLPNDEVFAALGSIDFADATAKQVLTIITAGPTSTSLTSSIQVLGKYGAGGVNGRVAEITGAAALNYSNFAGTATRTAQNGDVNLNGTANAADFLIIQNNLNQSGKHWGTGDLNGNGTTNAADFLILQNNLNMSGGVNTPININGVAGGAGAGAVVATVPEPTSIALLALAMLAGLGLVRRRK